MKEKVGSTMNINDFCHMRRGKVLSGLKKSEKPLLEAVDKRGQGREKALLALHGFSSSPAVYRFLLPQLTHYDAIVCPILTGHGLSIDSFAQSTAQDWLDTAMSACEDLCKNYQKVDVMGLSLGGLLACQLSQVFPLNHLYLLAPALKLHLAVKRNLLLAQVLRFIGFHMLRNKAGNILSPEHAEIAFRKIPVSAIVEILHFLLHFKFVPPTCGVDLFLGRHDEVVNSQAVALLFEGLDNVRVHWLENSAHVLPLDGDLGEIVGCVNDFYSGS